MLSTYITDIQEDTYNFPLLLESVNEKGLIGLFTDANTGTIVTLPHGYDGTYTFGFHANNWNPAAFKLFTSEVSICNESEVVFDQDDDADDTDINDEFDVARLEELANDIAAVTAQFSPRYPSLDFASILVQAANTQAERSTEKDAVDQAQQPGTMNLGADFGYEQAFAAFLAGLMSKPTAAPRG